MQKRNQKRKLSSKSKQIVPRFDDARSYAGQAVWRMRLPAIPSLLSTTVTTGVIASSYSVSTTNIAGFSSRFGSTFDEYRIVSAKVLIRPVSASTGISVCFFDEKSGSNPTQSESTERVGQRICNSNAAAKAVTQMSWTARDLLDLNFTPIGTSVTTPTIVTGKQETVS